MTNRIHELTEKHQWTAEDAALAYIDEPLPIQLRMAAFEPSQVSPELHAKYGTLISHRSILGCYLQTELGHGTNVAALETTASYLPTLREFELRSLENHRTLPGITIGNIGPKAMGGYAAVDNGFARFDRVRMPKEQMLSAFAGVTDEGEYVRPPHTKLSYGGASSVFRRALELVLRLAWFCLKMMYIRSIGPSRKLPPLGRQGTQGEDGLERQIITYPSVYHRRLLPILARAYVFIVLSWNITTASSQLLARLSTGHTSLLPSMHAATAILKVLVSTTAIVDLEAARRSLGEHGFGAFAGVGRLYADYVPAATYEGGNFVLDGQVVRAALKAVTRFSSSGEAELGPSEAYLRRLREVGGSTKAKAGE